jgi:hypothetical protein
MIFVTEARGVAAVTVLGLLGACAWEVPVAEIQGECGSMYEAQVCTWARMQGDSVIAFGARVPLASIENAPPEGEMAWPPKPVAVLALPAGAQRSTGFTHLTILWEAMGHPPGPYLTPHFDFHFYTISPDQRVAMDCADLSKPSALPSGYSLPDVALPPPLATMIGVSTLVGLCVPQMGMHSLLTTELESSDVFRGTMVIGYYQGKPIFVEPMITRAMLLMKRSFDLVIPAVPGVSGNRPGAFRADYDQAGQVYQFVFSNFRSGAGT